MSDPLALTGDGPWLLVQDEDPASGGRWLRFQRPTAVLTAERLDQVVPLLRQVDAALERGLHAAGFLAYEAGPAFDPALAAHPPGSLPLAWWGLFPEPQEVDLAAALAAARLPRLDWHAGVDAAGHRRGVRRIRAAIARGDVYQVNLTLPLTAPFDGDPLELFLALARGQRGRCATYLDAGPFAVCCASPELFFTVAGTRLLSRPMKGTARRGMTLAQDRAHAAALAASPKEQAENVMIVDMVRNDLGRIAVAGSVRVERLFAVETYPTLHQLTSTVTATSDAPLAEVFRALFPPASVTGAPKVRATELIRRLEGGPRGVYTGAVGFAAPGRRARFHVAIRTVTVDRRQRVARYGTGGGIVWDSEPQREYEECRTKARLLAVSPPPFELLETLLWRPSSGFFLLARHLERLAAAAAYFGFAPCAEAARQALAAAASRWPAQRHRVRLTAAADGAVRVTAEPWGAGRSCWRIGLDRAATDSRDPFLYHKTTHREPYRAARERCPELEEVVLWNERGELTETTRANLALRFGSVWKTPPVASGLLAGTYRAALVERGRLRQEVLPLAAFHAADEVLLLNSLRGLIRTERVHPARRAAGERAG